MKNKAIIVVAGDPESVFFEIFFKSIKIKKYKSPIVLICSLKLLRQNMINLRFKKDLKLLNVNRINEYNLNNKVINVIDIDLKKSLIKVKNKQLSRNYILKSFELAFKLIKNKFTHKLINGPINKEKFLNKKYLGVTEFIADKFKKRKIGMLIYNKDLSVCPLTTHLPIKLVSKKISKNLIIEKVRIINDFYHKNLNFKPKIAVTGLNPHCESILSFNEDDKIIASTIKILRKKKFNITGPFPADTLFLKNNRKKYDVILGMYHDQVLTPIKTLFEYDAINITMGLPFLRISPDHGPNEKMVGKNKSTPLSLIKAFNFLDSK